jgi:hypothetical protein
LAAAKRGVTTRLPWPSPVPGTNELQRYSTADAGGVALQWEPACTQPSPVPKATSKAWVPASRWRTPNTSVRASPLDGEIATPRSPPSIRTAGDPPIFVASSAVAASSATNWISPSNSAFGPRLEVAAPRAARVSNGNEVGVMRRWWHPHATSVACWKSVTTTRAARRRIASVFVSRRSAVGEARPR